MYTILVHVEGSPEPIKVDVEDLPNPQDNIIICRNPRTRGEKEVHGLDDGVTTVIYPWWRINYIQVLPSSEESLDFPLLYRE